MLRFIYGLITGILHWTSKDPWNIPNNSISTLKDEKSPLIKTFRKIWWIKKTNTISLVSQTVTRRNFPLPLFFIHPSEYCKVKLLSNFDKIFLLTIFQFLSSEEVIFYFQNQNFLIISHVSDIYKNIAIYQWKGKNVFHLQTRWE